MLAPLVSIANTAICIYYMYTHELDIANLKVSLAPRLKSRLHIDAMKLNGIIYDDKGIILIYIRHVYKHLDLAF